MVLFDWLKKPKTILSKPAVRLPGWVGNVLIWAELFHGVFIAGNAGGGKTSGPAAWILRDILQDPSRPGGLIPCVKTSDRMRIEAMIKEAGRGDDLVIISADTDVYVNVLEYELFRTGRKNPRYAQALDVLMEIFFLGESYQAGGASGGEQERFWDKSLRKNLTRLMMLLTLADMPVTIYNMRKILMDTFDEEDVRRYFEIWDRIQNQQGIAQDEAIDEYEQWTKQNFFLHCFDRADRREDLSDDEMDVMGLVGDYFFKVWVKLSEKTKSIVEESALGLFEPFMTGILKTHFSGTMSDEARPELCYEAGKIILIDVPIKEFGISAIYANGMMKKLFQLSMERRIPENETDPRPSFLYCDEYHFLVSPHSDDKFQSSCRSTMTAAIYITQSVNNIKISMGKDLSEAKTKAFLTNLGTQIACGNICRDTNVHFSELIGKAFLNMNSSSYNTDDKASRSTSEQLHYIVPPEHFATLKTGGLEHNYQVETIMVCRGKKWRTRENFAEITFDQRGRQHSFWQKIKSYFL